MPISGSFNNKSNTSVKNQPEQPKVDEKDPCSQKEHNINKVMWDAALDAKTCTDCQQYDGKIYDTNNTSSNFNPILSMKYRIKVVFPDPAGPSISYN